ncbi:hypothetical protein ACLOJK_014310, partial [Asimina triloba]
MGQSGCSSSAMGLIAVQPQPGFDAAITGSNGQGHGTRDTGKENKNSPITDANQADLRLLLRGRKA